MLLAGLSEGFIIIAVVYALKSIQTVSLYPRLLGIIGLIVMMTASIFGALRFLDIMDTTDMHILSTFLSKNIGVAAFVLGSSGHYLKTSRSRKFAISLFLLALVSLTLNSFREFEGLSTLTLLSLLIFVIYQVRAHRVTLLCTIAATAFLLSTTVWGVILVDTDVRIGVFHLCFGAFITLLAFGLSKKQCVI